MKLKQLYLFCADTASLESGLVCPEPSRAKQSLAEECDINVIVERFGLGYEMPQGVVAPFYADLDGPVDFHSAMNMIATSREAFDAMPADVRTRFHNDLESFVAFAGKPENFDTLEGWGLVLPEAAERRRTAAAKAKATEEAKIAVKAITEAREAEFRAQQRQLPHSDST